MSENNETNKSEAQSNTNEATASSETENYETLYKNTVSKIGHLENELKQKDTELNGCKKRITQLEEELAEAQKCKTQQLKQSEEVEALRVQSEDTLTRAKSMLFERTKVIKNQELQIEALNQQVSSMKDVVTITKDLLEIRNLEVKQLESKIKCMEDKVGAEKERYDLMHKKLEYMIRHNGDLKREYETQLCLFSALRERYNERELARGVVNELRGNNEAGASSSSQMNGTVEENGKEDDKK